ncbi:MAG: protein-export chaperone SecB [Hyphomicrobiaceae bacterium]|nr:protein-export chaperone SecB [Hyphomicrobiaceae bacterium]
MAENGNGTAGEAAKSGPAQIQAQIVAQYIKDLSFENPNITKMLSGPGENPNMRLEVNVGGRRVGPDIYESAIDFSAKATNKEGTIYEMELVYAGMFRLQNIPDEALEPFLLINCPTLLFPFLRRLVADISREGGFPPLLLDPIDFAGLYVRRKKEEAEKAGTA